MAKGLSTTIKGTWRSQPRLGECRKHHGHFQCPAAAYQATSYSAKRLCHLYASKGSLLPCDGLAVFVVCSLTQQSSSVILRFKRCLESSLLNYEHHMVEHPPCDVELASGGSLFLGKTEHFWSG